VSDTPGDGKCAKLGCENKAEYYPRLLLYARRGTTPATATLDLPLCNECMMQTRVNDLVTEEWWVKMQETLRNAGKAKAKKYLTEVTAVKISDWRK